MFGYWEHFFFPAFSFLCQGDFLTQDHQYKAIHETLTHRNIENMDLKQIYSRNEKNKIQHPQETIVQVKLGLLPSQPNF